MTEQSLFAKYHGCPVDTCDMIFTATFPEKDVSEYNLTIAELELFIHNIKEYANLLIATAVELSSDTFSSRADELKQREWIKTDSETDDKPSKIPPKSSADSTPTDEKTSVDPPTESAENISEFDDLPDLVPFEPVIIGNRAVAEAHKRSVSWCNENDKIVREWAVREIPGQPGAFTKYAAAHGLIDVLEDYAQFSTYAHLSDVYRQAIYYDQIAVVKWLYERQLVDIDSAEQYAASRGKLAILKYLISNRHSTTNFDLICEHAASAGQITVLQMMTVRYAWTIKWYVIKDIAAQNEQLELVAWIDQMRF